MNDERTNNWYGDTLLSLAKIGYGRNHTLTREDCEKLGLDGVFIGNEVNVAVETILNPDRDRFSEHIQAIQREHDEQAAKEAELAEAMNDRTSKTQHDRRHVTDESAKQLIERIREAHNLENDDLSTTPGLVAVGATFALRIALNMGEWFRVFNEDDIETIATTLGIIIDDEVNNRARVESTNSNTEERG